MKELTIEQKAKAYDEALERARKIHNEHRAQPFDVMTRVFPSLKESEDERIRKAIHIYLDWLDGRKEIAPRGEYSIRDMIAWLEKQGEPKPQGKTALEAIKEEKVDNEIEISFGAKDSELQEFIYNIPKGFHAEIDDDKVVIKKGENPATWSEEDEHEVAILEAYISAKDWSDRHIGRALGIIDNLVNKCKSIKDRVQPKQELSEEDEIMLDLIIAVFEVNHPNGYFKANELNDPNMRAVYTEEIVAWLKSLKERITNKQ